MNYKCIQKLNPRAFKRRFRVSKRTFNKNVCPVAIVTVVGTIASVMSLLVNVTFNALVVLPVRVTVAVAALIPAPSEKVLGTTVKMRVGVDCPPPLIVWLPNPSKVF